MNILLAATSKMSTSQIILYVIMYIVLFGGVIYFMMIRPQKKQQKAKESLASSLSVGDSIVTTSGFYGVVLDVVDDTVIVEFGNNKNCRIPMKVEAIAQIEKADDGGEDTK